MKNENMGVEDLYLAPEETTDSNMIDSSDKFKSETIEMTSNFDVMKES